MKAYAIVIRGHEISEKGYAKLCESSKNVMNEFEIENYQAVVPDLVAELFKDFNLRWTWPDTGGRHDKATNLKMHAYGGPPLRRHACALSHFLLWKKCIDTNEPILILEHDAIFINKFDPQYVIDSDYQMIGINDPRRATRLDQKFHSIVEAAEEPIVPCPVIDNMQVPQGIAGASAYVIKPKGAQDIIDAVYEHGLWPNDAIACQQLVPGLAVTKKYYTTIQGLPSTTFSNA